MLMAVVYSGENETVTPYQVLDTREITIRSHTTDEGSSNEMQCFQVGFDPNAPIIANGAGFFYSIDAYLRLDMSDPSELKAIVTAFSSPYNNVTSKDVLSSVLFAAPGYSSVLSMDQTQRIYLNGSSELNWLAVMTALPNTEGLLIEEDLSSLVYISTSYRVLDVEVTTEQIAYPLTSLFGDFAGMTYQLTGVGCVTLLLGLERVFFRCFFRHIPRKQQHPSKPSDANVDIITDDPMFKFQPHDQL